MEKPVHNSGKTTIYVAGRSIGPGETRHIPEHEIPATHRHRVAGYVDPADMRDLESMPREFNLEEFRAGALTQIIPLLPDLGSAHLDELQLLEEMQDTPRKGLIDAIEAQRITNAAQKMSE